MRQAGCAGVPQIGDLNGRWASRNDIGARIAGQSLQIDKNVDFLVEYQLRCGCIIKVADLVVMIEGFAHPLPEGGAIFLAPAKGVDLEARAIMGLEELHGQ